MRTRLSLIGLAWLALLPAAGFAAPQAKAADGDDGLPARVYRPADFYYYDDTGLARGLALVPKFAVFFREDYPNEKNVDYFELFNKRIAAVVNVEFNNNLNCATVEFKLDPAVENVQPELVKKLNAANLAAKPIALVRPVLAVDGREVVPSDRILLEATEAIDGERVRARLVPPIKTLGDFAAKAFNHRPEISPRHYELEIKDLRWPPNEFIVANLLSEQDWVKRARVVLRDFSFPLSVRFQFIPDASPTLGEKRYLRMTVVSGLEIELDKSLLPQLGQGEFYVKQNLPDVFFHAEPAEIRESVTDFQRITEVVWPFQIFAPDIYYFSPVNIPYVNVKTKENAVLNINPGRVMVNSILRDSAIDDIQFLRGYRARPAAAVAGVGQTAPVYRQLIGGLLLLIALVIVIVGLTILIHWMVVGLLSRKNNRENGRHKCLRLKNAAQCLRCDNYYDGYQECERRLRDVISQVFYLPYNIQAADLSHCDESTNLPEPIRDLLAFCLSELVQRFVKDYQPSEATLKLLADKLRTIADGALRREKR